MEHVPDHLLANICYMLPSMAGIVSVNRRFASVAQGMRSAYITAITAQGKIIAHRPSPRVCCLVTGVDIPIELLASVRQYEFVE